MAEIDTRFQWKSRKQDDGDFHFTAKTDEGNMLRVFQYPTGFWGLMVNGTVETDRNGRGVLGDAHGAIAYAENHGDEIAAEQLSTEK